MKRVICIFCLLTAVLMAGFANAQPATGPKPLAPGVLTVVSPQLDPRDSFSLPLAVPGLDPTVYETFYTPQSFTLKGQTKSVVFYRDVWHHEFATLGLRKIRLAFRQPDGSMKSRIFWYMVYRIRNVGQSLSYDQVEVPGAIEFTRSELQRNAPNATQEAGGTHIRPIFELRGWVTDENGDRQKVEYRDQYLPVVAHQIQLLEDPHQRLLNKLEIQDAELPVVDPEGGEGVWGVAVWENVDPEIDFISVEIEGLTNAYRISVNDQGRFDLHKKVLRMNFWRPGDEVAEQRDKIDLGIPLVDATAQQIEICRRYELPGPQVGVYIRNELANRDELVAEFDAQVNLDDLESPVVAALNEQQVPEALSKALTDAGLPLPGSAIETLIRNKLWRFQSELNGEPTNFVLKLEPEFWEIYRNGVRFLRSLDHFWTYQ